MPSEIPWGRGYFIRIMSNGKIRGEIRDAASDAIAQRDSTGSVNDGAFHHVAVVFTTHTTTRDSNTLTLYRDGVLDQVAIARVGTGGYAIQRQPVCPVSAFEQLPGGNTRQCAGVEWRSRRPPLPCWPNRAPSVWRYRIPSAQWTFAQCAPGTTCHTIPVRDLSGNGFTMNQMMAPITRGCLGTGTAFSPEQESVDNALCALFRIGPQSNRGLG